MMNASTYVALENAGFYNLVDRDELEKLKQTSVPAVREKIDFILRNPATPFGDSNNEPFWGMDRRRFTDRFRFAVDPRDRMDEVAVTFILFLSNIVSQVEITRTFVHPGSWESVASWHMLFRWVVFSIFSLLYNVRSWKPEYFLALDELTVELCIRGDTNSLRRFAAKLGIHFMSSDPYPAEIHYTKIEYHTNAVFGPYYWRMLHWMSEALAMRTSPEKRVKKIQHEIVDIEDLDTVLSFSKTLWKEFLTDAMYRTLRCGICIFHYDKLLNTEGWKKKISDSTDKDFPKIWYDIHNEVNRQNGKSPYSVEEWEVDRQFMRKALEKHPSETR